MIYPFPLVQLHGPRPILKRPHLLHLALRNCFCPGNVSFPNIASTPMPTRKSVTILKITSKPKPRELHAFFDA